jgi:hypothetical protein
MNRNPFAYQPRRTDRNQASIVKTFRRLGCTVQPMHEVGGGFPDLAVGVAGLTLLVEVKDGEKPPSHRRLTDPQRLWHFTWLGQKCVVTTDAEAVALVDRARRLSAFLRSHGWEPNMPACTEAQYTEVGLTP